MINIYKLHTLQFVHIKGEGKAPVETKKKLGQIHVVIKIIVSTDLYDPTCTCTCININILKY